MTFRISLALVLRHMQLPVSLLFLLCIFMSGCSTSEFPLAPVSGVVTLDGQPLQGARLTFQPRSLPGAILAGPPSYGITDAAGRYQLETHHGHTGAVVAIHRVTISTELKKADEGGTNELIILAEERLPPRYNNRSRLTYEVTEEGTDKCDFELTSSHQEHTK